jgi:hypothetical protein
MQVSRLNVRVERGEVTSPGVRLDQTCGTKQRKLADEFVGQRVGFGASGSDQ